MQRAIRLSDLLAQMGLNDFDVGNLAVLEVPAEPKEPDPMSENREVRPHRLAAMGIPQETIRLLEHPERMRETAAIRAALELLGETERCWGVIAGGMGTGKSVAAGWWLSQVKTSRGEGAFYVASEDVAQIPVGTGVQAEDRLARLMGARALVLDDVGVRDSGPDGKLHPTVQRVLSRRYEHRLKTLCTMNLGPPQWRSYLGEARLVDRWDEIGAYKVTADASLRRRTA